MLNDHEIASLCLDVVDGLPLDRGRLRVAMEQFRAAARSLRDLRTVARARLKSPYCQLTERDAWQSVLREVKDGE